MSKKEILVAASSIWLILFMAPAVILFQQPIGIIDSLASLTVIYWAMDRFLTKPTIEKWKE